MTYTFDMKLCDNEIDKSYERFPFSTLKQLATMSSGMKGRLGGKLVAEVMEAKVAVDRGKLTKAGDPYCWVKARVNIELNDETSALIYEIEHGEKNPVSVGCSVERKICSICGAESCSHVPGDVYGGQLCYKELYGVQDIYEWRFVETMKQKEKDDEKNIPKICELLSVEIGERFQSPFDGADICIDKCGLPQFPDYPQNKVPAWIIADMINKPTTIIRKGKWAPQEIEDAKAIQRMFGKGNFTHIRKDEDGWPSLMDGDGKDPNVGWCSIGMEKDMFPSLKPGETVTLDEIVGCGKA